ncbi:MAG TPA: SpoIIE family protein phosphatase [Thermoanaerobaculia bacterium]|nr:SpoIIE family protein phosphatase [Thermoanaerobaculia bacterium]
MSPAGDPLGYERVAAMLAVAAPGASAAQIVERLMAEAESWRGAREQNDDIALVVLRVR